MAEVICDTLNSCGGEPAGRSSQQGLLFRIASPPDLAPKHHGPLRHTTVAGPSRAAYSRRMRIREGVIVTTFPRTSSSSSNCIAASKAPFRSRVGTSFGNRATQPTARICSSASTLAAYPSPASTSSRVSSYSSQSSSTLMPPASFPTTISTGTRVPSTTGRPKRTLSSTVILGAIRRMAVSYRCCRLRSTCADGSSVPCVRTKQDRERPAEAIRVTPVMLPRLGVHPSRFAAGEFRERVGGETVQSSRTASAHPACCTVNTPRCACS